MSDTGYKTDVADSISEFEKAELSVGHSHLLISDAYLVFDVDRAHDYLT